MSRAPSVNDHRGTNGQPVESVRAKGGYEAYFSQGAAPTGPSAAGGAQEHEHAPAQPYPNFSEPVIGAPGRPPQGAGPDDVGARQGANTPEPAQADPRPHQAPSQVQATVTNNPSAHGAVQQEHSVPPVPQAPQTWVARPESAGAVIENRGASWQSDVAPPNWVPDRIDRSAAESVQRVEVLPALTSMDLLADITAANRARLQSSTGVRGALNKVGFKLGLSPAEQRTEERRARIRRQLDTTYQIAVISVKGGVGKTTTVAALGSTFAALRPDRVVAVDANPDFGDLPTRTSPHPYGLTLRDLAQSSNLQAFSTVQSFMSINSADLAVVASPWTTEANEALSGREYATAVEVLRRHYNLLVVDCGTGVLDSATISVLQTSDAVVVVTPATVGGVKGAVATLNWLSSHGMQHLIAKSVVSIAHQQPSKPIVDVGAIEKLFATGHRPTCVLPYDVHLAEGGEIDLRLLEKDTLLAFEELAAWLADGFPNHLAGGNRDTGAWR